MSLSKLFIIGAFATTLAGCGSSMMLTASASVDATDPARIISLIQASERVLVRRLAGAEVKNAVVSVSPTSGSDAAITMKLPDEEAVATATRILGEPFTFAIKLSLGTRVNEDGVEEADWEATGVEGASLLWIQPVRDSKTGILGVELQFNEEGLSRLKNTFAENVGKDLGIFVRDLLVSKLTIGTDAIGESIVINGIPSEKIAEIFADDVNVGLHVHFSVSQ